MSNTSIKTETTKRISDEVFAEVERELASVPAVPAAPAPAVVEKTDRLNQLSELALPYVWMIAIGVWVAGLLILQSRTPITQCIGAGAVVALVLSSVVFAWRSRLD